MLRRAQFAGQFYPQDAEELSEMVERFLQSAKAKKNYRDLRALIVPHAGFIFSGSVAGSAYKLLSQIEDKPSSLFLLGPSHQFALEKPVGASFEEWETPLGRVEVDLERIKQLKTIEFSNQAHQLEHSLEVQLPFLQKIVKSLKIIPLLINHSPSPEFIEELEGLVERGVFIIVSSDLSHYYPYSEAVILDQRANSAITSLNLKEVEERVEACGKEAILSLMKLAQDLKWEGFLIDYKNSGDTFGDKSRVVGYGAYGFREV